MQKMKTGKCQSKKVSGHAGVGLASPFVGFASPFVNGCADTNTSKLHFRGGVDTQQPKRDSSWKGHTQPTLLATPLSSAHSASPPSIPKTVAHRGKEVEFGYRKVSSWERCLLVALTAGLTITRMRNNKKFQRLLSSSKYWASGFHIFVQFALAGALLQLLYRETMQLPKLLHPKELSFENSKFEKFDGLNVHSLRFSPRSNYTPPVTDFANDKVLTIIHCNHGFGASALSYCDVGQELADTFQAQVIAHDTPGFGLTERPSRKDLFKYCLEYNAEIGLHALTTASSAENKEVKYLLFGHSMGALTTLRMALRLPPEKTSVVFISPAVRVPLFSGKTKSKLNPLVKPFSSLGKIMTLISQFLHPILSTVIYPFIIVILRPLVYEAKFWRNSLRNCVWDKPDNVNLQTVNRYRWPSLVKHWDRGMAWFCLKPPMSQKVRQSLFEAAAKGPFPPIENGSSSLLKAFQQQIDKGLKVIIVHGATDKLVPVWNSRSLANLHPNIQLIEMPGCGHVAHEEEPEEFMRILSQAITM